MPPIQLRNRFISKNNNGRLKSSLLFLIREKVWNYPDLFFTGISNLYKYSIYLYKKLNPFSNIITGLLCAALIMYISLNINSRIPQEVNNQITEAVLGIPDNLNPVFLSALQVQKDVYKLVFNSLFHINKDGTISPELAKEWNYENSGRILNIVLRDDVYWHDGEKFTAYDVEFTINLFKQLEGKLSYYETVNNVETEVVSDNNIKLKIQAPSASFIETINWYVLPKHILEKVNINNLESDSFGFSPIGTGPYKFSLWEEDSIILEKNSSYFVKSPNIENITFISYPSQEHIVSALLSGKIDSTSELDIISIDTIHDIKWISTIQVPLLRRYWAVYYNYRSLDILKDEKFRQALTYAIDKERLLKEDLKGYAEDAKGPLSTESWAYNSELEYYSYNIEKAKSLLDELGYKIPDNKEYLEKDNTVLELELSYVSNPVQDKVARKIEKDWKAVGVKVDINPLDYITFRDTMLIPRTFHTILFGVETLLDPDHFRLWHSTQVDPPGRNFSSYRSPKITIGDTTRTDYLLDKGRDTLSQEDRKKFYLDFQEYIINECPVAFLYHPVFHYVYNSRIKNVNLDTSTTPEERFNSVLDWKIE